MSKLFCVVLNYNHPGDTIKCIRALHTADLPKDSEVVIVDNGHKNLSFYFFRHTPGSTYIHAPSNLGYAAGNNLGIQHALRNGATHVMLINPDVTIPKHFFDPLLSTFHAFTDAGIVAPAHTEGRGIYGLGGIFTKNTCSFPFDNVSVLPKMVIPYELVTFACVLLKREVLTKVGLLDERYFMYIEDVDYCLLAHQSGYGIYLNPLVVVEHRTSSSYADPRHKIIFTLRSLRHFISKWYSFPLNIFAYLFAASRYLLEYARWTKKAILKRYA